MEKFWGLMRKVDVSQSEMLVVLFFYVALSC